ncbi:MAG: hypothetical protein K1X82_14920 [Bacteroidia bacterium]|nr:hypothetical protein [Bacteroidia bacterium]
MVKFAHLLNPVYAPAASDLGIAQPITFESIRLAKDFARNQVQVQCYTTQFEEDLPAIPPGFIPLSNLDQSVLDFYPNLSGRKLPLIRSILEKSKEITEFDYLIYTNMDIGLMPSFYVALLSYIEKGHDCVVINRRRLSKKYRNPSGLPEIYADLGLSHPGFDCFVIKKDLLPRFVLDDICVGIPFLEAALVHNVMAFGQHTNWVMDAHLTFHIGLDVLKESRKSDPFYLHNRKVFFKKIYPQIKSKLALKNSPYAREGFFERMFKYGLNPSIFFKDWAELQSNSWKEQIRNGINELRWRLLQK